MTRYYMDDVRDPPIGWTLVRTIAEMKALLASGVVDECSLDHDMGLCDDCLNNEDAREVRMNLIRTPGCASYSSCIHLGDGSSLVAWMEETGHWPKSPPQVHSANPVGAARMRQAIRRHYDR